MALVTRSCALGALILLGGYLFGAVLQNDPVSYTHLTLPTKA